MRILQRLLLLILVPVLTGLAAGARAHEVRPAYLEITQLSQDRYAVFWKQPAQGDRTLRLDPSLSNGWLAREPAVTADTSHVAKRWEVQDPRGLDGVTVSVAGLEDTMIDVLVHASLLDGRSFQAVLKPALPTVAIAFAHSGGAAVSAYFTLGVEHILTGFDHLAFVLGLLLLVGLTPQLLKAITAFTVAHSLTLAASALGLVQAPPATIEALVALSILVVAVELVRGRRGAKGMTQRHPWVVAFAFGLLHGFAFAGALRDTGLPQHAIPQALLLFNLGVEAGQLIFVAAAGLVILGLREAKLRLAVPTWAFARAIPEYALGMFAAYWLIERTTQLFA